MNFRQVHLDFHTSEAIENIGARFSKKQFCDALKAGHVNSITVFSKCHHGWAYHPSKANEMHPHLSFDLLKAQIEAAHEIGVKTPVYLSAGFDEKSARKHPEWILSHADPETGMPQGVSFAEAGYHRLCFNTPYLDYLLAQVKEVCENYDADGIFLDIVAVTPCYCPTCTAQLIAEGKDPSNPKDVLDLAERVYANYCHRVRETIDSVKPGLPVFHNSGHIDSGRRDLADFDSHLELESLPTGGWGYDHFPLTARYSQGLGKEFLGMTGKFHKSWGEFGGFKHKNALRYEACLSVANGAKCSIGDQLAPNGFMDPATYSLIGAAYKEVEEKEPWLDNVNAVTDIALFSTEAAANYYNTKDSDRVSHTNAGCARILLEGHFLFDVVDAMSDFTKYKVLILPDSVRLDKNLRNKINAFLQCGGKILASGKGGLNTEDDTFSFDLGAQYLGECEYNPAFLRPQFEIRDMECSDYVIYANAQNVKVTGTEHAQNIRPYFNRTKEHFCSHIHTPSSGMYYGGGMTEGKDGIYIAWDIFEEYATEAPLIAKRVTEYAINTLLGNNKTLTTDLPTQGVTTLMDQKANSRLVCHTLYVSPVKRGNGIEVIEDIIPLYQIPVSIRTDKKIKRVYLAPQKEDIPYKTENGVVSFVVPKIECGQITVLDYE